MIVRKLLSSLGGGRHSHKKVTVSVILLVVAAGSVFSLKIWSQGKSYGTIVDTPSSYAAATGISPQTGETDKPSASLTPPPDGVWQTKYFTTRLSQSMRVRSSNEGTVAGGSPVLASYVARSAAIQDSDQIAITISSAAVAAVNELPAVKVRANAPANYEPITLGYLPAGAIAYRQRIGDFETSIFWVHGSYNATVVTSGSIVRQATLQQTTRSILEGWQWR